MFILVRVCPWSRSSLCHQSVRFHKRYAFDWFSSFSLVLCCFLFVRLLFRRYFFFFFSSFPLLSFNLLRFSFTPIVSLRYRCDTIQCDMHRTTNVWCVFGACSVHCVEASRRRSTSHVVDDFRERTARLRHTILVQDRGNITREMCPISNGSSIFAHVA